MEIIATFAMAVYYHNGTSDFRPYYQRWQYCAEALEPTINQEEVRFAMCHRIADPVPGPAKPAE